MVRIMIVAALGLLLSGFGAEAQVGRRIAASGVPILLYQANTTNPDCSPMGRPVIRHIQTPQHGRLIVSNTSVFPNFSPSNVRSACNSRRVPGVVVKYVSRRGYAGMDSTAFEVYFPTGIARRAAYNILVR